VNIDPDAAFEIRSSFGMKACIIQNFVLKYMQLQYYISETA
jgi:hypothetical protein